MSLELITGGRDRYVLAPSGLADALREYLVRHGVPCDAPAPGNLFFRTIWLGEAADLGYVRAQLDRWFGPAPSRPA